LRRSLARPAGLHCPSLAWSPPGSSEPLLAVTRLVVVLATRLARGTKSSMMIVASRGPRILTILTLLACIGQYTGQLTLTVSTQDLELLTNSNGSFTINLTGSDPSETGATSSVGITFAFQDGPQKLLRPIQNVSLAVNSSVEISVETTGLAGHVDIVTNTTNNFTNTKESFVGVTVMKSETIELVSTIIGWIYFVAWSVSFWPQIVENFRRKSVIGLNFDFLSLNLIGFTLYGCFNVALFWVDSIQAEYYTKHPRGVLPVTPPDVFFPIHAVAATSITIFQCFIFERGNQKVSKGCLAILLGISIFIAVTLILAVVSVITWLDMLYYFSYVKLGITIIKYVPQAYMNFRRKSTVGWSIGNILLDFTGGSLSIVQMILIAHNNDDWSSIFGDPTKFGLGFFSVLFDIFFMLQHYVFYRGNLPHETLAGSNELLTEVGSTNPEFLTEEQSDPK